MLLWFAGLSFVLVAWIFASPLLDYRLVMLGAVLPALELALGGPWALHTLLAPVVAMTVVMVGLRGRRLAQRRWLGIPIGMFVHLVLDGAWADTSLFWWPAFGWRADAGDLPTLPSLPVVVAMELAGLLALAYGVRRYGLNRAGVFRRFVRSGHLTRTGVGPDHPTC